MTSRRAASRVLDDAAAAKLIRNVYGVGRVSLKEGADVGEVRRMAGVLKSADSLRRRLLNERAKLELRGYTTGPQTLNAMVACLADCGLFEDAAIVAADVPKTVDTYGTLVRAASYSEVHHDSVEALWREAALRGHKPTSYLYGAYLAYLSKAGHTTQFLEAYEAMQVSGVRVRPNHHAMRLLAAVDMAEVQALLPEMQRTMQLRSEHLDAALKVAQREQDAAGGQKAFDYMVAAGVWATEKTYTTLLCVYRDAGDVAGLRASFAAMRAAFPSLRTAIPHVVYLKGLRAAVADAVASGNSEQAEALTVEAVELFEAAQKVPQRTHSALLCILELFAHRGGSCKARAAAVVAAHHRPGAPMPAPIRRAVEACGLPVPPPPRRRDGLSTWEASPTMKHLQDGAAHQTLWATAGA